jgi:hypothetical protein
LRPRGTRSSDAAPNLGRLDLALIRAQIQMVALVRNFVLSIASRDSAFSIASVGSCLSVGSVGSFGSILSVGSGLSVVSILAFRMRGAVMRARSPING